MDIPANWDAQSFILTKMYESGMFTSDQVAQAVGDAPVAEDEGEVDTHPDSWFTREEREQFAKNRKQLEGEFAKKRMTDEEHEEYLQLVFNYSVADAETVQRQDEVREHMKQWINPWL